MTATAPATSPAGDVAQVLMLLLSGHQVQHIAARTTWPEAAVLALAVRHGLALADGWVIGAADHRAVQAFGQAQQVAQQQLQQATAALTAVRGLVTALERQHQMLAAGLTAGVRS
ncbi:hypothetical protein ABZU32_35670 [Sphaerisporangium sp. NPDC005288]|uniref:hypothetical protein n=1 Tax=Sphaerisporangium sp. NPDC005288 TaxID=3155114 RepID=UPI0033AAF16D